jgi:hypothetical protein
MIFILACPCGAVAIARGIEDRSVNAAEVTDEEIEWHGGSATCSHEGYEIIHAEYEEPQPERSDFQ